MNEELLVIWADGREDEAIEVEASMWIEGIESLAKIFGCSVAALNMCSPGKMDFYGVTLK